MMELSSESDSDDCQLYTKAAENIALKKKNLQSEYAEFEKVIPLDSDDEVENVPKEVNVGHSPSKALANILLDETVAAGSKESDDEMPLATIRRSLRNRGKRKKPQQSQQKAKSKRNLRSANQNVSAPPGARNLGVIVLDDDTEYTTNSLMPIDFKSRPRQENNQDNLNNVSISSILSYESDVDENFDDDAIKLSVEWNNGQRVTRKEFQLRKYQKLETIFNELAKVEGLPISRVLLMHNFNSVRPSDTPSSLNLKFYGALTGSIASTDINHDNLHLDTLNQASEEKIEGLIAVKLQLESQRTLNFTILKTQKLNVLYRKCSEELKCEESKIRLIFDGDCVEPNELVSDIDVEDGDVFHVHIKH